MPKTPIQRQARELAKAQRELEIQNALERIRNVALKMRTTEDIGPVVVETRDALISLGIRMHRTHISLFDRDDEVIRLWTARRRSGFGAGMSSLKISRELEVPFLTPRFGRARWMHVTLRNKREVRAALRKHLKASLDKPGPDWLSGQVEDSPVPFHQYLFRFSGGSVGLGMDRELEKGEVAIARRVTEAFDFAYKRLVELEEKEARAREAEVEASLERIRSRALEMETSDELIEVASALHDEIISLGYDTGRLILGIADEEADTLEGVRTSESEDAYYLGTWSLRENRKYWTYLDEAWKAKQDGQPWCVTERTQRQWEAMAQKAFPWMGKAPRADYSGFAKRFVERPPWFFFFDHGWFQVQIKGRLSDDDLSILSRYADVFGFAYKRFLDLQAKEQRAREAEIEAALERVRSQALSMQTTADLPSVSAAMFRELDALDLPILSSSIAVVSEDRDWMDQWTTVVSGLEELAAECGPLYRLDPVVLLEQATLKDLFYAIPQWKRAYAAWKRTGQAVQEIQYTEKTIEEVLERIVEIGFWTEAYRDAQLVHEVGEADAFKQWLVFYKHGHLCIDLGAPLSDLEVEAIGRFADVFGFAYDRFLDLQDKERRAREAEVEAAIERVRSQTLAMETSADMPAVSAAVFREYDTLKIPALGASIGITDPERNLVTSWAANTEIFDDPDAWQIVYQEDLAVALEHFDLKKMHRVHPFLKKFMRASPDGKPAFHVQPVSREDVKEIAKKQYEFGLINRKQRDSAVRSLPDDMFMSIVQHAHGYTFSWLTEPLSDTDIDVVKRFAETFSHAYDRFLELQEKERRAREAEIEAALERVRSQALAMETSEDLPSVAAAAFREFRTLYPEAINTVIGVVNDQQTHTRQWIALSEDIPSAAFAPETVTDHGDIFVAFEELDLKALIRVHRFLGKACRPCKQGTVHLHNRWSVEQAGKHFELMAKHGLWSDDQARQLLEEVWKPDPWGFDMDLMQNRYGYLFVMTRSGLTVPEIEELSRFSETFANAYDRFLDLQDKERRAREAEVEAALERVRSQALGMETSVDLPAVSAAVFREMRDLSFPTLNTVIGFPDPARNLATHWPVIPEVMKDSGWDVVYEGDGVTVAREFFDLKKLHQFHPFMKSFFTVSPAPEPVYKIHSWTKAEAIQLTRGMVKQGLYEADQVRDIVTFLESLPLDPHTSVVQFRQGYIFSWLERPMTESEVDEARRFAETFSFAYDRFLDLQDKERRAREAEVEAAIERIRGQALAMETSADLPSVSAVLNKETRTLYADAVGVGIAVIGLCDEQADQVTQWTVLAKEGAGRWADDDFVVDDDTHVQIERFQLSAMWKVEAHWKQAFRASDGASVFMGKTYTLKEYVRCVRKMTQLGQWSPQYGKEAEAHVKTVLADIPSIEMGHVQFKHGYLWSISERPRSEQEIDELQRIGDVFSFAYDRFLDLQDKERRAREAEVEAAIERIRSQALAMETSEDIPAVLASVFRELKTLQFQAVTSIIGIPDTKQNLTTQWVVIPDSFDDPEAWQIVYVEDVTVAIEQFDLRKIRSVHPFYRKHIRAAKDGETSYHTQLLTPADFATITKKQVELGLTSSDQQADLDAIDRDMHASFIHHANGYLLFYLLEALSDSEVSELKRIAETFSFAYDRYLDLQDKERRAREAEVEAAVERIRSQALAMETSEDLPTVAATLHREMRGLFESEMNVDNTVIGIVDEERNRVDQWVALPEDLSARWTDEDYVVDDVHVQVEWFELSALRRVDAYWKRAYQASGGRSVFLNTQYTLAEGIQIAKRLVKLGQWTAQRGKATETGFRKIYGSRDPIHVGHVQFKQGYILTLANAPYTETQIEELKRIGDVFAFAYDRFLDLQEKEAQNRELTIQNALERVRSRALGMQTSDDLPSVSSTLHEQMSTLGIRSVVTSIEIVERENGLFRNTATFGSGEFTPWMTTPLDLFLEIPVQARVLDAFDSGQSVFTTRLEGKECREHQQFWIKRTIEEFPEQPDPGFPDQSSMSMVYAFFRKGWIYLELGETIGAWGDPDFQIIEGEPLSEADLAMVQRFAEVFGFAYDRFLELRQKEDQNRELTIQNGLERVRARAEGMQTTDDMPSVSAALFRELNALELPILASSVCVRDEANDLAYQWTTKPPGLKDSDLRKMGTVFEEDPPVFLEQYRISSQMKAVPWAAKAWETNKKTGQTVFTHTDRRADIERYFDVFVKLGDWTPEVAAIWRKSVAAGFIERTLIVFKHGYFHCGQEGELDASHLDTLTRFAEAFGFAYDRFLELKEKEAQNRELTIQNALERVRARALGMQESDDLRGVSRTLFSELNSLGLDMVSITINVRDHDRDLSGIASAGRVQTEIFARTPEEMESMPITWMPLANALRGRVLRSCIEAAEKGVGHLTIEWPVEDQVTGIRQTLKGRSKVLGRDSRWVTRQVNRFRKLCPDRPVDYFPFTNGALRVSSVSELSEAQIAMIRRFVDVFDFAYERFRELKQKEEQNRELTIQNALERVRARAQGMQESEELNEVVWDIFEETSALGLETEATIIALFGDLEGPNESWWAGKMRTRGDENRTESSGFREQADVGGLKKALEQGEPWHLAEFRITKRRQDQVRSNLATRGLRKSEIERRIAALPDRLYFHRVFFSKGLVGFSAARRFETHELEVLKRFADAFDFAYKRFVDLQAKEEQNRELTIQNALERVRARVEGMQESNEIAGVATAVYDALSELRPSLFVAGMATWDRERGTYSGRSTHRDDREVFNTPEDRLQARPGQPDDTIEAALQRYPDLKDVFKALDDGIPILTYEREATRRGLRQEFDRYAKVLGYDAEWKKANYEPYLAVNPLNFHATRALFSRGMLWLNDAEPPDDAFLDVAQRFAAVVDFAYKRFVDLQAKEEQNRELTIQNALERVRARALGMQESAELAGVVTTLFEEFTAVGQDYIDVTVWIVDQANNRLEPRTTGAYSELLEFSDEELQWRSDWTLPRSISDMPDGGAWYTDALNAGSRDVIRWHVLEDRMRLFRRQLAERKDILGKNEAWVRRKLAQVKEYYPAKLAFHHVFMSCGSLGIRREQPLTEEEVALVKRFADVFDFAYGRFKELQEKEDQNRELTIQNALERVRARAEGMQESSELSDFVDTLFTTLTDLGLDLIRTGILVHESDDLKVHYEKMGERFEHLYPDGTELTEHRIDVEKRKAVFKGVPINRMDDLPSPWGGEVLEGQHLIDVERAWHKLFGWPLSIVRRLARETNGRQFTYWHGLESNCSFSMASPESLTTEELGTVRRFTEVFDYAFGRFLELKQKEEQNRELMIQNALERVRARALGMQESNEIAGVSWTLYDEFQGLGYDLVQLNLRIYDDSEGDEATSTSWVAADTVAESVGWTREQWSHDPATVSISAEILEARRSGARWHVEKYAGLWRRQADVNRYITMHAERLGVSRAAAKRYLKNWPDKQVNHRIFFSQGQITLIQAGDEHFPEDKLETATRFAEVFDFAYSRFLELKQKEEQNRELTIQNALERVRARALGMQESAELAGVVTTLFEEFTTVGQDYIDVSVWIVDQENDSLNLRTTGAYSKLMEFSDEELQWRSHWRQGPERTLSNLPGDGHWYLDPFNAGERDVVRWDVRENRKRVFRSQLPDRKAILGKDARWVSRKLAQVKDYYPQKFAFHHVFMSCGSLGIRREKPLTEEEVALVKRFADVFDFAYGRFRELQEKEDQNLELTIQNALERVRSRALGMQTTDDLPGVSAALFREVSELDFDLFGSFVGIVETEKDLVTQWSASPNHFDEKWAEKFGYTVFDEEPPVWYERFELSTVRKVHRLVKEGYRVTPTPGQIAHVHGYLTKDELFKWNRRMVEFGIWSDELGEMSRAAYEPALGDGLHLSYFQFDYGYLWFLLHTELTDEQVSAATRFAEVISFAYDRFHELRQKEEQNRELAIEAGLERVRSRALAMENFDDLNGVAHVFYDALDGLDYDILRSTINVFDKENAMLSAWVALTGMMRSSEVHETVYEVTRQREVGWLKGGALPPPGEIRDRVVAWQRGDSSLHQVRERARDDGYRKFLQDSIQENRPELAKEIDWDRIPEVEHHTSIFNEYGWVQIVSKVPLSEDQTAIARRFVDLFAFAYSRFKELDAKEHANRELAVEAALERVRSRVLAMESEEDLNGIVFALFEEFENLGFGLLRTTVGIYDLQNNQGRSWRALTGLVPSSKRGVNSVWSTLVGDLTGLVEGTFPSEEEQIRFDTWKEKSTPYLQQVRDTPDGAVSLRAGLKEQAPDLLQLIDFGRLPDRQHLTTLFFSHGVMTLSSVDELDESLVKIGLRFADLFGFAYDRFKEVEAKDRANRQLRLDAALERVHANVASMQTTDDIGAMMGLVYREIEGLGIDLFSGNIIVVDEEKRETRQYALIPQELYKVGVSGEPMAKDIVEGIDIFRGDRPIHQTGDEIYSVWKSGEGRIATPPGSPEDRKRLVEALQTQFGLTVPERELPRSVMRVPFSHGVLLFYAQEQDAFGQDDLSAVSEFAEMVTLGYARYLDFQRLEEQNRELAEANERVVEATRMKSQFLATMSHELRTPMNAIVGFTQLVLRRGAEQLTDRHRGNLEKVKSSADHLLNLINDILDLSKVEAGRVEIQATDFELKPLLEQACSTVGPTLGKPGVEVRCDVGQDVGAIYSDEARLRQVVINLLSNALKFTDEGSVSLSAQRSAQSGGGDSITIAVADTGIGIPADQLGTIFEEFRQVDGSSTRRHQGTGLGLAITKRLVELMGGSIDVTSSVGRGSTFTIQIPAQYRAGEQEQGRAGERSEERVESSESRVQSAEGSLDTRPADATPASAKAAAGRRDGGPSIRPSGPTRDGGRTIVSIDDDPNVGVLLREMLEEDGYTVISALNADEGVALVKKHRPAAVTVDILMPGKDGWTTIGMLKEDPATRDIPVIVVSGMANRELGFSMGVKDYVVKPFDQDAIVSALKRISPNGVKDILVVDDEPSACELVCEMLDETGYETRRASNGKQALEEIRRKAPDAMFLDLMMPELDGFGVIEALQENEAWKEIPVIVVTAKDLTIAEEDYLKARVEKVVQKGQLDGEELRRLIIED